MTYMNLLTISFTRFIYFSIEFFFLVILLLWNTSTLKKQPNEVIKAFIYYITLVKAMIC